MESENAPSAKYHTVDQPKEYQSFAFSQIQAALLDKATLTLTQAGGPQRPGAIELAEYAAITLRLSLTPRQRMTLQRYADGQLTVLEFSAMQALSSSPMPSSLPSLESLQQDQDCLYIASRNQILLHLVQHRAFAYDIDNEGQLTRFVANFRGGGLQCREDEKPYQPVELSSHAGLALGPHTEAPYHCAGQPANGRSPAPSALILSARWNPHNEPTQIIPMAPVLECLSVQDALALTSPSFDYSRSDSFVQGQGEEGKSVTILQFDANCGFSLRYNSYRHSLSNHASPAAATAFHKLMAHVRSSKMISCVLTSSSAVIINNYRALHCRDIVHDNRRLLIRLFGYSRFVSPIVLSLNPLVVKG